MACARVDDARNTLYGSLLQALRQRLDQVRSKTAFQVHFAGPLDPRIACLHTDSGGPGPRHPQGSQRNIATLLRSIHTRSWAGLRRWQQMLLPHRVARQQLPLAVVPSWMRRTRRWTRCSGCCWPWSRCSTAPMPSLSRRCGLCSPPCWPHAGGATMSPPPQHLRAS